MKTTDYTITPVYQDDKGVFTSKVKTYQVTNSLRVTLKDTTRPGRSSTLRLMPVQTR